MFLILYVNMDGLFFLEVKRGITFTDAFETVLDESNYKPNKIWVHKGSEFYNRSIKLFL